MGSGSAARQWALPRSLPAVACPLTPRQTEVVQLAANGMNARQIGRYLGLSVRTVEGHVARARRRIGAVSLTELVARAAATGVVSPGAIPAGPEGVRPSGGASTAECVIMFRNLSISEHDHQAHSHSMPTEDPKQGTRGRPTLMTPDRIEAAAEMLSSHTVTQIARKLGVSRGTVHAHMQAIKAAQMIPRREG